MHLAFLIYLAGLSDHLRIVLILFGAVFTVVTAASVILTVAVLSESSAEDEWNDPAVKGCRRFAMGSGALMFVFFLLSAILPSASTVYMMVGAEAATAAVKTPQAQQIITKIEALVNKRLDNAISDK